LEKVLEEINSTVKRDIETLKMNKSVSTFYVAEKFTEPYINVVYYIFDFVRLNITCSCTAEKIILYSAIIIKFFASNILNYAKKYSFNIYNLSAHL